MGECHGEQRLCETNETETKDSCPAKRHWSVGIGDVQFQSVL